MIKQLLVGLGTSRTAGDTRSDRSFSKASP
jgi:hypothetical protein